MSGRILRAGTTGDVPALLDLFSLVYGSHATSPVDTVDGLTAAITAGLVHVADIAGAPVGYIARRLIAPGLLGDGTFLLHPDHRGHGHGTALLTHYDTEVPGTHPHLHAALVTTSTGYAHVDPSKRSAVQVYRRSGYRLVGVAGPTHLLLRTYRP